MTWNTDRRDRLPANWQQLRAAVRLRAGGRCEALDDYGQRCRERGTDCDHIIAGDDHSLAALQWLCRWHHARKSASEGAAAAHRVTQKRPPERHPGLR